ncbi:APC family permease [Neolewinella lacunae]|uniref:APC family permease n=1 Tax=Neolewinella lacunae TaxID=1517758 RepID=A0A923TAH3_9BACT|nr:APC family permease [Neolewinella lacunae]MBC6996178.1 APC family permease [Neolewinella lacunae]MDN3635352.1 APC family permease [Neolewinella lacunae]
MSHHNAKIGWRSAAALVLANMIGTGAFTTLGLQLEWISSGPALLLLWAAGGLVAWCGAVSYAELGTRLPRSGGEAHFLGEIFHPLLGFLSGWVSLTVGFAAAVALSAMAVGHYLAAWTGWPPMLTAAGSIVLLSLAHSLGTRQSSRLQNVLTGLKLLVVLALGVAGACLPAPVHAEVDWSIRSADVLWSPGAGVAMISVFYAFSGWNAAAYIVEEIDQPRRNLPRALVLGTLLVSGLFLLLQYGFLRQAGSAALRGQIDVAQVAAEAMFGPATGQWVSVLIGVLLLTGISAMIWVGPRVVRAMGDSHQLWRTFGELTAAGIPLRATWLQGGISLFLVFTSSFERVLLYSGFVLQLFTFLAVVGLLVLRARTARSAGYSSPLYPLPQLVFLAFSAWSLGYLLVNQPLESLLGLLNVVAGLVAYFFDVRGSE